MSKFHINPETGETNTCTASKRECKYGGTTGLENHYTTEAEAKNASEKILSIEHGSFNNIEKLENWEKINFDDKDWDDTLPKNIAKTVKVDADGNVVEADTDAMVESLLQLKKNQWPKSLKQTVADNTDKWFEASAEEWGMETDDYDVVNSRITQIPDHIVNDINDWYADKDPRVKSWEKEAKQEFGAKLYNATIKGQKISQKEYNALNDNKSVAKYVNVVADAFRKTRINPDNIDISPSANKRLRSALEKGFRSEGTPNPDFQYNRENVDKAVDNFIQVYKDYYNFVKDKPKFD